MVKKCIVVDAKGHLVGRIASIVAKQIQLGQRIVIVRYEKAIYSGKHYCNKLNFMEDRRKHNNINPRRGGLFHQTVKQNNRKNHQRNDSI